MLTEAKRDEIVQKLRNLKAIADTTSGAGKIYVYARQVLPDIITALEDMFTRKQEEDTS